MAENSNGWDFEHGLDEDFMKKLEFVAKQGGWFSDVLADRDLILGIRNNYMNVYRLGCSLFKIERNGAAGSLKFTTHPKYLVDPDLSKEVEFDGSVFHVGRHRALSTDYDSKTLDRMKRTAKLYSGDEKDGVHKVVCANPNVIDTEVTFNCKADEENELATQRIDLACFEETRGSIWLRFWEAKLYSNKEIRAEGDTAAPVVRQVRRYRDLVEQHRAEIAKGYGVVARNLVEIAHWVDGSRKVGELVQRVAAGERFAIDEPPVIGLIIYGYDGAQKNSGYWKTHIETKLKKEACMLVRYAGKAKDIKLLGTDSE